MGRSSPITKKGALLPIRETVTKVAAVEDESVFPWLYEVGGDLGSGCQTTTIKPYRCAYLVPSERAGPSDEERLADLCKYDLPAVRENVRSFRNLTVKTDLVIRIQSPKTGINSGDT
jgi:hypothetical protein